VTPDGEGITKRPLAAAVTARQIGAGMLFLFTFVHWYESTIDHEQ
jgi:hypothetical protein